MVAGQEPMRRVWLDRNAVVLILSANEAKSGNDGAIASMIDG
jgi:hypothetical protein